jgi:hypothetical protein
MALSRESDMKIGILGSGDVAKALAGGFLEHGHGVMLGTRTLWCIPGFLHNDWIHAFKLLTRP